MAALTLVLCGAGKVHAAADCSVSAVSLNFDYYDPLATGPDDSVGTVTVTCKYVSSGATRVNYRVTISNGMNGPSPTSSPAGFRHLAPGLQRVCKPGALAGVGHRNGRHGDCVGLDDARPRQRQPHTHIDSPCLRPHPATAGRRARRLQRHAGGDADVLSQRRSAATWTGISYSPGIAPALSQSR